MSSVLFFAALGVFTLLEIPGIRKIKRPTFVVILLPVAAILSFMWPDLSSVLGGIVLIISGADRLIAGAEGLARRAGLPPLLIGILIIGLGTSTPELFVNVLSALEGDTQLALGNILGSNIANLGLVIGLGGLIAGRIKIQKSLISTEVPILFGVTLLLVILLWDKAPLMPRGTVAMLSRQDGIILLMGLLFYLLYTMHSMKQAPCPQSVDKQYDEIVEKDVESDPVSMSIFKVVVGVAGLYFGGDFTITGAVSLATAFGAGTMVLGVIVGVGTSLPELATAISCAIKGETDLIVGNVVGSNIFNILLILGITSLITPVAVPVAITGHLIFLMGVTTFFFISLGSKRSLSRFEALFLALAGVGYLTYSLMFA